MSWAKMEYTCEVYGLFAAYINQGADTAYSVLLKLVRNCGYPEDQKAVITSWL